MVILWGIAVTFRTELQFCWEAILIATVTNTALPLKAIYSKKAMVSATGEWLGVRYRVPRGKGGLLWYLAEPFDASLRIPSNIRGKGRCGQRRK